MIYKNMKYNERIRFNNNATNYNEALEYTKNRYIQLLKFGAKSMKTYDYDNIALIAIFEWSNGKQYYGIYIYKEHRNKGLYELIWKSLKCPTIVTLDECNIVDYLQYKKIKYVSYSHKLYYRGAYEIIEKYYGNKITNRSNVHLINHIDEGLAILENIFATQEAKEAYILHPMLQDDAALLENFRNPGILYNTHPSVLILAMEYRKTAMAFLPKDLNEIALNKPFGPVLSVLKDVNDMLIADKIQNQKDFYLYNSTIENANTLKRYFAMWIDVLNRKYDFNEDNLNDLILLNHETIFVA